MKFRHLSLIITMVIAAGALLGACHAGHSTDHATSLHSVPPITVEQPTQHIGIWIRGLELVSERETEVIGLIFTTQIGPYTCDAAALTDLLATAPISATFRSAREAWAVSSELKRSTFTAVNWYAATYDNGWTFEPSEPPRADALPYSDHNNQPFGDPDSGIGDGTTFLTLLPPPLQRRGVAIARNQPKANSLGSVWPRDLTLSVFTSWDDMEARLRDILIDGELVNWQYPGFHFWSEDGRQHLSWKQRAELRSEPD